METVLIKLHVNADTYAFSKVCRDVGATIESTCVHEYTQLTVSCPKCFVLYLQGAADALCYACR